MPPTPPGDGTPDPTHLQLLNAFAVRMLESNDLTDLPWGIAESVGDMGFEDCVVYLREDDVLVQVAAYGPRGREIKDRINVPVGEGIVGSVAATGVLEIVEDTRADPRYIPDQFPGRSELAVPVLYQGRAIGVLDVESSERGAFGKADAEILQAVANIASSRLASARAEKDLRIAKERPDHLVTVGPVVVYTAKASGDFGATFISGNVWEQLGYAPEAFTESSSFWVEHIHPDDVERVIAGLPALFEAGRHTHEYRFLHGDGVYRWIRDELRVIRDSAGEPLELVGSLIDITEQKRAEETRAWLVLDSTADGIIVLGEDGRIQSANAAAEGIFGYGPDELIDQGAGVLGLFVDAEDVATALQRYARAGVGQPGHDEREESGRAKDGSTIALTVRVKEVRYSNERIFIASVQDITERKAAAEALRRSEQNLRSVLEGSPDGIVALVDGQIVIANTAAGKLAGRKAKELLGTSPLDLIHPDDRAHAAELIAELLAGGRPCGGRYRAVQNGQIVPVEISTALCTYEGKPALVSTIRNDTDRVLAEEALRTSEARLLDAQRITHVGNWERDLQTGAVWWSKEVTRIFGITEAEFAGTYESYLELVHPEDRERIRAASKSMEFGADPIEITHRILRPDGTERVVRQIGEVVLGGDGEPVRLHGAIQDVTDQARAEESLRRSEQGQRALLDALPDIMVRIARNGDYLDYREPDSTKALIGVPEDGVLGHNVRDVLPPDTAKMALDAISKAIDSKETQVIEYELLVDDSPRHREARFTASGPDEVVAIVRDFTKRKRQDDSLRESARRLNESQSIAHLGSWGWDVVGGGLWWSDEVYRIFGCDPRTFDPTYEALLTFVHPDDRGPMEAALDQALQGLAPYSMDHRIVLRDGTELMMHDRGVVERDETGAPVRMVGTVQDVTEARAAEAALTRTGRILEESLHEIYLFDAMTLEFLQVNRGARQNLDYSLDELRAMSPADLKPAFTADSLSALLEPLRDGSSTRVEFEAEHLRKDGSRYPVSIQCHLSAEGPSPVIVSMVRDLSEQSEAKERYRALFEHLPIAVFVLDAQEGFMLDCNEEAQRLTGYTREELSHLRPWDLDTRNDTPGKVDRMVKATLAAGQPTFETVIRRKDGQLRDVVTRLNPMETQGGAVIQLIAQDVTDARLLEEQLAQAQRMEAIGRLAGGVAHDFNNLLTVILGVAEMALEEVPRDAPVADALRSIESAGERAAALTAQLLAFSRKQIVEPTVFDVNEVVRSVEQMMRRLIGEDVRMVTKFWHKPLHVRADRGQFEQVLANLVVNARDAMPQGGDLVLETLPLTLGEASAEIHPDADPGLFVVLRVQDTGEGMSEEVRSHVFEPFFTTKREGEGTGLGLATAYGIVTKAGGHIQVDTAPGQGAVFSVCLPAADTRVGLGLEGGPPDEGGPGGEGERILLVEDNEGVRTTVETMLGRLGYTVIAASSGAEALGYLSESDDPIHMLLTDVVLSGMGGREVAERVSAARPGTGVLFMTGYTDDVVLQRRLVDQDADLIHKPIVYRKLAQRVRAAMDRRGEGAEDP